MRIIKYVFLVLIIMNFVSELKSQDLIYLKDYSDTIKCEIIKDNIKNIEYRLANSSDSSIHIILTSEIEGYVLSQKNIENINANSAGYTSRDSVFFKGFNEDKVLPKKSVGKYIFGSILMFVGSIIIPVAIITGTSQEDNGVYDNQFRTGLSSRNVTGIAIATVGIGFAACGVLMISTDKK
jgi:hypothetical protein